jgi:uncharacterized MnhB-related membrane protein
MAGEELIIPSIFALVMLGSITALYKKNPLFSIIEHSIIGVVTAQALISQVNAFNTQVIDKVVTGADPYYIITIVLALFYFGAVLRPLRTLYRFVLTITMAIALGVGLSGRMVTSYNIIVTFSQWTSIENVVMTIVLITTTLYFIYQKKLSAPLKYPRQIGMWFLWIYFALGTVGMWGRFSDPMVGRMLDIATGPGIYIGAILLAVILIDVARNRGKSQIQIT